MHTIYIFACRNYESHFRFFNNIKFHISSVCDMLSHRVRIKKKISDKKIFIAVALININYSEIILPWIFSLFR